MTRIITYLTFNGNCREGMTFYKECLDGELYFQTVKESPMADKLPDNMVDFILHASLKKDDLVIMGTDMVDEYGLIKGNTVSIMLECDNENEMRIYYEKLSYGGDPSHPIEKTFRGSWLGGLTDKYGHHWILHLNKPITNN